MCIRDRLSPVLPGLPAAGFSAIGLSAGADSGSCAASLPSSGTCLLYTSDAADDLPCVDLGGCRIIKKKKPTTFIHPEPNTHNTTPTPPHTPNYHTIDPLLNIPVHHTNEIAQTEARVGTRLANFWMHGYFLTLNNAKMAKSAGEFLRMKSLTDRGYDPLTYRFLCLTAHYRTQMSFSWDAMDAAQTGLDRLRRQVFELGPAGAAGF